MRKFAPLGVPKEKRYPAQMIGKAIRIARPRVGRRYFTAPAIQSSLGRAMARYQSSERPTTAGKYTNTENFERTAIAVAAPNHSARFRVGLSIQMRPVRNAAPKNAVNAISVVANAPCASTGGVNVKRNRAATATALLK